MGWGENQGHLGLSLFLEGGGSGLVILFFGGGGFGNKEGLKPEGVGEGGRGEKMGEGVGEGVMEGVRGAMGMLNLGAFGGREWDEMGELFLFPF